MTLNQYQLAAARTAVYPPSAALTYPILLLAEEAGEVVGKIAKFLRDGVLDRDGLRKELGDVLWALAAVATDAGFTLEEVGQANIDKLADRESRGVLHGAGDDR